MRRSMLVVGACGAIALLAGCGSGGSDSSSSSSSSSSSTSAARTATSSLKPSSTTPNYASPPANAPVLSGIVQVAYRNIAIDPGTIKVKVGSTIKWTNYDQVDHNVTSQSGSPVKFASKEFNQGGTFTVKADKPGVIHYLCTLHPASMNGTISVEK
ncbi:MAG TPA: plastocyanin/azurin family copper-binding protein [Solirubrobacteraceae bacterium]|nr:plastocyanin/azurin family copper-binding protein [Solirubrobacteraceae bacterium]